jgi:prepilin-type processing-associated H-X9-DG protein
VPVFNGPTATIWGGGTGDLRWEDVIYPYVKSEQIFNCPSMTSSSNKFTLSTPTAYNWTSWGGYGMNAIHFRYWASLPQKTPCSNITAYGMYTQKMSALEAPATTVWVLDNAEGTTDTSGATAGSQIGYALLSVDAATANITTNATIPTIGPSASFAYWQGGYATARHLETINTLYCDGHVKAMKLDSLVPASQPDKYFTVQDD